MASAQYLQALGAMRQMQQQTVSKALKQQSSRRSSGNRPMLSEMRPMQASSEREVMGQTSPSILSSDAVKRAGQGALAAGAVVGSAYINSIGDLTGNQAAENATKNTVTKGAYAVGTGFAAFKAGQTGLAVAGTAGAAIAAVAAIALAAMLLAIENEKMMMRIQNRQAQSAKDQQRLGYISAARGR